MTKNLVIVESPAKAKTIEGFLGKEYLVKSSYGHVRDLAKTNLGVDVEKNFTPNYEIPSDKKPVVNELKKFSKEAETVWLATDEDREGEAISWHLAESLKLDKNKYKRIVFHEITPQAIKKAIESPRKIDDNLVNAQQARRILDRLVGFQLSPLLWKKVKPSLSAGRVQSVAVRLIVEREREIQNFKPEASFRIIAYFQVEKDGKKHSFKAELPKRFKTKKEVHQFLETCKNANYTAEKIETKPSKKSPAAPFTTSTLQQEASRKLGFSVARTMIVAQRLYESGKITYMRTDSVNLADSAISTAKKVIKEHYGEKYIKTRKYSTKSKGAQEAHEAIRPTYLNVAHVKSSQDDQKLYDLIWKRTIASQMSEALLEKTNVTISISTSDQKFHATGEVLKFDGFLKVYIESTDDDDDDETGILPPLKESEKLQLDEINAIEKFSKHPPRFTEASLVKKLEELGIGRPSTYAPTISTIQKREYIAKENREGTKRLYTLITLKNNMISEAENSENTGVEKNKLFPTDLGIVVNNFLIKYFKDILDYNFTASLEKKFDDIAYGNYQWNKVIDDFYWPFSEKVEKTMKEAEKFSGERLLGKDPATGRNVYVKIGRYGPMIQIGDAEEEEKPKFAPLLKNQSLESITFQEAMDLLKLPRKVGSFEGKELIASIGRFGPYIKFDNKFFSIPKGDDDPLTINENRAIEIIKEKREAEKKKIVKTFNNDPEAKILKGRWGIYLVYHGENFKIPKTKDPESITYEECLEITKQATSKKKSRTTKKKSAKKK